jgi:hypothetical protein
VIRQWVDSTPMPVLLDFGYSNNTRSGIGCSTTRGKRPSRVGRRGSSSCRQFHESEWVPGDRCVRPKQERSDAEARGLILRVLTRFPDAYHAVLEAFRSCSPDEGDAERPWSSKP